MAEIIELEGRRRERVRRRERALTASCITILEQCLAESRDAYGEAPPRERFLRATKIHHLEELIDYATHRL